jgi:hypothetical protein
MENEMGVYNTWSLVHSQSALDKRGWGTDKGFMIFDWRDERKKAGYDNSVLRGLTLGFVYKRFTTFWLQITWFRLDSVVSLTWGLFREHMTQVKLTKNMYHAPKYFSETLLLIQQWSSERDTKVWLVLYWTYIFFLQHFYDIILEF